MTPENSTTSTNQTPRFSRIAVAIITLAACIVAGYYFYYLGTHPARPVAAWRAGHNGTLMNGLEFADGNTESCFKFNGINSYLLADATSSLNVGLGSGLTFEGWINPATLDHEELIYEFESNLATFNGGDTGINCSLHPERPGELDFNLVGTDRTSHELDSPLHAIITHAWQHIAVTYDRASGLAVLYINGVSVKAINFGTFTPETSLSHLVIGARTTFNSVANPGDAFSRMMEGLNFYNRALSPAEIQATYNDAPRDVKLHNQSKSNNQKVTPLLHLT